MFFIKVNVEYCWIPDGAGGAMLGQRQGNYPAAGATGSSSAPVMIAQSAADYVGEVVPGGDSPANSDFQTALNSAATDLYTQFNTAGDVPGFTNGTLYAQVAAFSTGGQ